MRFKQCFSHMESVFRIFSRSVESEEVVRSGGRVRRGVFIDDLGAEKG